MNVYDFDETVYKGESSVEFFLSLFKLEPSLIRFLPDVAKTFFLYKKEKITFDELLDGYGKKVERFFSESKIDMENEVRLFWDRHMKGIKPLYLSRQREDDVIITASPDFLMSEICKRLGIKNLICTGFDLETGKITSPCFRESKVDRFLERYPDGHIDEFYTDSGNDKFLMPYADKVFIVKGGKIKRVK